jgi:hypothetical protein
MSDAARELRDKLVSVQLEHETSYTQRSDVQFMWTCKCMGDSVALPSWDACHKKTREHWADVVLLLLSSYVQSERNKAREPLDKLVERAINNFGAILRRINAGKPEEAYDLAQRAERELAASIRGNK